MMVTQSKAIEALLSKTEKEKQTNFQRITSSPESLAEFIAKSINDTIKLTNGNRKYTERIVQKEFWLEWLKQESDTE
jgi:hypothetical protein